MESLRRKIEQYIHEDHSYMTLAAYEQLPKTRQTQIKDEAGLLIRWFCELPDFYWELFGKLGGWEINNNFYFDWRRNLKASFFLGCNPVTERGTRYDHVTEGALLAVPDLLSNAIDALRRGELRDGLAFAGAACHYIQDVVTFPEQQSVHRRSMANFEDIAIPGYQPKILFSDKDEIKEAVKDLFNGETKDILSKSALVIRKCMRNGDNTGRRVIQLQCDNLGAKLTADILHSVLQFYVPVKTEPLDCLQDFSKVDEERLPDGYFIDRDDALVCQGYAAVEGNLDRGYDTCKTPGLQLRLSATGNTEVRWKQSILDASPVISGDKYEFFYSVYCDDLTGDNGCRLIFYDECWNPCETIDLSFNINNGWDEKNNILKTPKDASAVSVDFYSKGNRGTVLVDHWKLRDSQVHIEKKAKTINANIRLLLAPGEDFKLRDLSDFSNQNEPITSLIGGTPGNITSGDDFLFDGESHFIEIPYHSVYQPLWIEEELIISFDFFPKSLEYGTLIMSAGVVAPASGWRLRLNKHDDIKNCNLKSENHPQNAQTNIPNKNALVNKGCLAIDLYNEKTFSASFNELHVNIDKWNHLECRVSPKNEFKITLNKKSISGESGFPRKYSKDGHYIGADYGVADFFNGKIRNLQINTE